MALARLKVMSCIQHGKSMLNLYLHGQLSINCKKAKSVDSKMGPTPSGHTKLPIMRNLKSVKKHQNIARTQLLWYKTENISVYKHFKN